MTTEIDVPAEQEGTKAVVKTWLKNIGEPVRVNDPVVELETDKVAVEIAAEANGVLSEILIAEGAEVEPGTILGRIADSAAPPAEKAMQAGGGLAPKEANAAVKSPEASQLPPGIRRLLEQRGLKPNDVPVGGAKLTRDDIEAEVARRAKRPEEEPAVAAGVKTVPHDSMRRRIAEHMSRSLATAPHVTAVFEADFSAIVAHRNAHKAAFESEGANLTFTAYFIAASVAAMKAAPAVNGRWFEERIEIYDDINIGIGTALGEKGLIVPVIHRAQTLSLLEIATRLTKLTEKARNGKLTQADM